ncbi:MAG: phosphatase PAP2 family protein [Capsulimonas sp.]|uniref:phosphatase PAP2 family protein n=1 Tax=Capsulimonas sp. TaxID=2494211 RepID=UPI0032635A49
MTIGLALSILAVVIFAADWNHVHASGSGPTSLDHLVIGWIHQRQAPWWTDLSLVLAGVGSTGMMIAISVAGIAVGARWRRLRDMAWTMPICALGAGLLILGAKAYFHRDRPTLFTPIMHATGYSFPSGHSLFAMSVYGLLGYFAGTLAPTKLDRRLIHAATLALILAIGVSRIYLGVHYPTDVLAGWMAGLPWLVICIIVREALGRTLHKSRDQTRGRAELSLGKKRAKSLGATSSRSSFGKRRTPA